VSNLQIQDINRLQELGFRLYGKYWKGQLATATDYSQKTISHWVSGKSPVPKIVIEFLEMKLGE
jgi:hypothetical protein